jgi:dihydroorotate dehydrogenase
MERTYAIDKSYAVNYERGPQFSCPASPVPPTRTKTFLGKKVHSRTGIAAGLLLNSRWVIGYARRGFDILTYKTVRSSFRPCYPLPNWVFVEPLDDGSYQAVVTPPDDPRKITSSVCFGMPSMAPDVWRRDVERAKNGIDDGQALIVSVVATPQEGWTIAEVADDFVQCARWAAESGADVVEANFSCPNVCTQEGSLYLDPAASGTIAHAMKSALPAVPLLIKTGFFSGSDLQAEYLRQLSGAADGVTMVNGLSRKVVDADGRPVFGEKYPQAGILGSGIHAPCVANVARAKSIIDRDALNLDIAAVGGVSTVADIGDFFEAGAGAVLMGGAPMYLPNLAAETKARHPEW